MSRAQEKKRERNLKTKKKPSYIGMYGGLPKKREVRKLKAGEDG